MTPTDVKTTTKVNKPITLYGVKQKLKKLVFWYAFISLVLGLGFAILYPLLKLIPTVLNSIEDLGNPDVIWIPIEFSTVSFQAAIRLVFGNGMPIVQSILYAALVAGIQIFVCALAGYALGRVEFWGRSIIMFLVILTFVVPPQSLLISQYLNFKDFDILGIFTLLTGDSLDLINKPITLFLLAIFGFGVKQSMFVFMFTQFFKGLPKELEEASLIDGSGFYRTYFNICLPNAIPSIMTVGILSFVWNYGDTYYTGFFHPDGPYLSIKLAQTFASSNVDNIIYAIQTWYSAPSANVFAFDAVKQAAAFIYLLPLLIIYFAVQKKIVQNFEQSGIVG